LKAIANRIHALAVVASDILESFGFEILNKNSFFDTIHIKLNRLIRNENFNIREVGENNEYSLSFGENFSEQDLVALLQSFNIDENYITHYLESSDKRVENIPDGLKRVSKFLTHPVFNSYHSGYN
jgi:glycine dehydrogenase